MTQEINLYVDKIVTPREIENLLIDLKREYINQKLNQMHPEDNYNLSQWYKELGDNNGFKIHLSALNIDRKCSRLMYGGLLLTYKGYGSCISAKILANSWKSKEELETTYKEMISTIKKLQKKFHGNIIDVDGIMKSNSHKEHYEEE